MAPAFFLKLFSAYILSYLIGAIPFGLIYVRLKTGKDIRTIQSGRTGGTNSMRAAGFWVGLLTAVSDMLKSAYTVYLIQYIFGIENPWLIIFAPIFAIIGHNYSVYIIHKDQFGRVKISGGAGGAPCLGGSLGIWFPSGIIIFILGAIIFYFVGYASVTTLSVALLSSMIFGYLAITQGYANAYVVYGILSFALLALSLKPNIKRLFEGTERLHGFRAMLKRRKESKE